jgi:predicted nucleic acid-binding protein
MAQNSFYVDSCIWLNLFKKEGDSSKGIPYWKIAEDFVNKVMFSEDDEIIYSGLIIREIQIKSNNEDLFKYRLDFIKGEPKFRQADTIKEDEVFARKLESASDFEISFYDCMHVALCKRLNLILVTRDNALITFAKEYISADKPENLFG